MEADFQINVLSVQFCFEIHSINDNILCHVNLALSHRSRKYYSNIKFNISTISHLLRCCKFYAGLYNVKFMLEHHVNIFTVSMRANSLAELFMFFKEHVLLYKYVKWGFIRLIPSKLKFL